MPSKIPKHPAFANKVGVPQKIGKQFNQGDKSTGIIKNTKAKMKANKPAPMLGSKKK